MITVLRDPFVPSPDAGLELPDDAVFAVTVEDALARVWPSDAHACQYAPVEINGVRLRLPGSALEPANLAEIGGAVHMVARFGDLDGPGHVATPEWRVETRAKLTASGLAWYETTGGFRTVERLPPGCTIESTTDAAEWRHRYRGWCVFMQEEFGLTVDTACDSWMDLFRLPNVVRKGTPVTSAVQGAITVADWSHFREPPIVIKDRGLVSGKKLPVPDDLPEPNERVIRLANAWRTAYLAGNRVGNNELLNFFGWGLGIEVNPWDKGEFGALLMISGEPNASKLAEHFHILGNAVARTGPGAAREWLGASFREVDAILNGTTAASGAAIKLSPSDGAVFSGDVEGSSFSGHAILRSRDGHVTLLWDGDDRGYQPIAPAVIRNRIQELPIASMMVLSEGKRQKSIPAILDEYGRTYTKTVYDFSKARTEYDENGDGLVVIGFPPRGPAAAFDRDADAWLRALGGELYPRLEAWLASCAQRHIDRLAACLIVIGEADVGKSLLAQAVARTWGAAPPAMGLVVERFNGDMLTCPVLVDEEAQLFGSGGLSSKRFRDIAQARSRPIEHKGKEKVLLVGAQRYIVGCNGVGDIRFRDLEGGGVIGALHDRLLVVNALERTDVCRDALARLRLPGSYEADLMRIAAHIAWLGATITPAAERFIGSGGSSGASAVLAGHADANATILDMLQTWLDSSDKKEDVWFNDRAADLLVDPKALTEELMRATRSLASPGETGWTRAKVTAALAPFRPSTHVVNLKLATGERRRVWHLDRDRLSAAGVDFTEPPGCTLGTGAKATAPEKDGKTP